MDKNTPIKLLNTYFGIHYDMSLEIDIENIIDESEYRDLLNKDIPAGYSTIFITTNSDDEPDRCIIGVSHMIINGPEMNADDPAAGPFIILEPCEMYKLEHRHHDSMDIITDIYELIISRLKEKNILYNPSTLYLGWCTYLIVRR